MAIVEYLIIFLTYQVRDRKEGYAVDKACKDLMILHRSGLFMLERIAYRERVREAVERDPEGTMSTIIDGASQNHCTIPHSGPGAPEFKDGIQQHLQGALTHGLGLWIYRTYPTVKKGSNLTIHVLLDQLRLWAIKHGRYPTTWYIQVDGGSENANKYVLATLEFLCAKRLVKTIFLTRLPVGHTHEDIDACFG